MWLTRARGLHINAQLTALRLDTYLSLPQRTLCPYLLRLKRIIH